MGALVVWGGPKIFAAGADIKAMADWGPEEVAPSVEALGAACDLLEDIPKVSIAAVNGYALGGGFELALGADLRYLAEDARVGQPEIMLGVIPGAGGTQRLTRAVGPGRARELVYSGRQVEAEEAVLAGPRRTGPAGRRASSTRRSRTPARSPTVPARRWRRPRPPSARPWSTPAPEGLAIERERFLALFGGHDQREGMRAFLEKRPPRFAGRSGPPSGFARVQE